MEHKSLKMLQEKVWYRLIKVIFFIALVFVSVFYSWLISSEGIVRVDQDKTTINCLRKDRKVFSPNSINVTISRNDLKNDRFDYRAYFENYNDSTIKTILKSCYDVDATDVYVIQRLYEFSTAVENLSQDQIEELNTIEKTYITSGKLKHLDYSVQFFGIHPQLEWQTFLKEFIKGNLIIILVFELMRRVFYYIATGKLNPPKE